MTKSSFKITPVDVGVIHFIGIGGIGMSGIACILNSLGYSVQGSDTSESYVVAHLRDNSIPVYIGHSAENLKNVSLVVKSSAISDDNPEIISAKQLHIPIIKRSEMLAEIMRFKHCIAVSGTHGKTTTTSLIAKMLEFAKMNPTVINGGIINEIGTNAKLGSSEFLVAEADESDGTFIKIPAFVAVVTNIDPEHLDYYGNFENAKNAYLQFIENLPFYGFGVLCFDHPVVQEVAEKVINRQILSYGIYNNKVDIKATNIKENIDGSIFDVEISETLVKQLSLPYSKIEKVRLGMLGEHNISNSLASIAIALKLGISKEVIQSGLMQFKGVKRRFTKVGEINSASIIDDYAHHPAEIVATLKTAKKIATMNKSKVIAIMQPHRYSRIKELLHEFSTCFKDADILYISEIYSAGEKPIPGVTSEKLVDLIKRTGKKDANLLQDHEKIPEILNKLIAPNDIVIFLGAGDITKWAYSLVSDFKSFKTMEPKVA